MADIAPEDLVRFFAYRSGGHMATTRLHKLAYLSQLYSLDRHGRPLANLQFIRYHHGPWSPTLAKIVEDFEAGNHDVLVEAKPTARGVDRLFKPKGTSTRVSLTEEGESTLAELWADLGYVPTEILIAICKAGALFTQTKFEEEIDLKAYGLRRKKALSLLEKAAPGDPITVPFLGLDWEVTKEDSGYSTQSRDLPACITQGETLRELEGNMLEALLALLDSRVQAVEASS